jgi:hypothetical protein
MKRNKWTQLITLKHRPWAKITRLVRNLQVITLSETFLQLAKTIMSLKTTNISRTNGCLFQ